MTHQSTITVLENRISYICFEYRDGQNAPCQAGLDQGDLFVRFQTFLP